MDEAREESSEGVVYMEYGGREAGESDTWLQFGVCLKFEEADDGDLKHHRPPLVCRDELSQEGGSVLHFALGQ